MVKIRYSIGALKLRVTYTRPQDFVADHDGQFARGGLLVRVSGVNPEPNSAAELELVTPFGSVTVAATVFQVLAGAGVAVGFDVGATPAIANMIRAARAAAAIDTGSDPQHQVVAKPPQTASVASKPAAAVKPAPSVSPVEAANVATAKDEPAPRPARRTRAAAAAAAAKDIRTRIREATPAEQMQIALHGGKDERNIIIRGPNRRLHQYVIRNPHIQLEEVAAIARMPTVSVDILKFIAERREWAQRPEVALGLVRNPKTPVPMAVRSVQYCSASDLRQLAKVSAVRGPVQRAIRKKVLT